MCIHRCENSCNAETKKYILNFLPFCKKIKPYVDYYRKQIKSYNDTAHYILKNEINLILLQLPAKQKHGIVTTLILGFIGLAYKGISSFLHNRRHKAVKAMDSKPAIQHDKLLHWEDSVAMYGIFNAETLEQLINTVHHIHNTTTFSENLFAGQ